eukprot:augustus_masked-scaffold_25-processed-gene-5.48-mRNA-1 protein AED:1.00 eAED:1.00 QI:0/0/0/0/1/1/4/0/436
MASIPTTSLVTSELILQLVEALKPGITDIVHEAVTQLRDEILEKQNKNQKRTEKQHKNKEVIGTDEEEVTDGLDKQNDDNSTDHSEYSFGGSQRRGTRRGDGRKESDLDVGKARLNKTQMSGKPMLKGLQADEIYKFQLLFSRWEKAVVQEGLGLTEATIMNYLSEEVLLELHMSKIDTSSGAASKKASILTDVSRKVKWTNEGNISVSMSSYLQQVDKLLLGIELAEDPYLDKFLCLEVLKRLAKAFKDPNPKHTIKRRRWTSYYVMRKDLSDLTRLLVPPQDFDDPALRMAPNNMGPVKREPRTENVRDKQPRRHPQGPGGVEQRERKKEYAKHKYLCLFCFTEGHRINDCKKVPGRESAVVGGDTVNATTHYEDTEPESSGVSIFSDEECYRVHVFEDPDSEEQEEKAIVRTLNEVTRELKCPEPSDPSGLEA